jgi:hypothetical protein
MVTKSQILKLLRTQRLTASFVSRIYQKQILKLFKVRHPASEVSLMGSYSFDVKGQYGVVFVRIANKNSENIETVRSETGSFGYGTSSQPTRLGGKLAPVGILQNLGFEISKAKCRKFTAELLSIQVRQSTC